MRKFRGTESIFHLSAPPTPPWKLLWPILGLAFLARVAVALNGDFLLHPDELTQYLEPAHRLAFGNGIVVLEYYYGMRSWIVPGSIAAVLWLFDLVGLGHPDWYVGGVKCALALFSLSIPAGMYFFARQHFGETAARIALIAGSFWYELAGFAHKPMADFIATGLLMGLLALCAHPRLTRRVIAAIAVLAVLTVAIRFQYAPPAAALLALLLARLPRNDMLLLAACGLAGTLAVGILDAVIWDGALFHSYVTNYRYNIEIGNTPYGDPLPAWQYGHWLLIASFGLGPLCLLAGLFNPRRYGLLLALTALVVGSHALVAHKEYRFIFVCIPLWLLIGSDLLARFAAASRNAAQRRHAAAAAVAGALSLAGIANILPEQERLYFWNSQAPAAEPRFLGEPQPMLSAFRYLAGAPGVEAVWMADRNYEFSAGYYRLHHAIPFYNMNMRTDSPRRYFSHIVTTESNPAEWPDYALEAEFNGARVLRRIGDTPAIPTWEHYSPVSVGAIPGEIMARLLPDKPPPPANYGIELAAPSGGDPMP